VETRTTGMFKSLTVISNYRNSMKRLCLILVFVNLFIFKFYGQEVQISEAESLRNLGNSYYETNPENCIVLLDSAAQLYEILVNHKQQAYCYQNIAFAYNEKLENIDSSINYIEKAIPIWIEIQDPINHANILKYLGMLQGQKGQYSKGIETIRQAITLFDNGNFKAGIAVSYFDLALLYDNTNQIDSSIHYFDKNKVYFESKQDTGRIFTVNNKLFEIYIKTGNYSSVSEIYKSNLNLENSNRVYWQQLIDYYRISMNYFKLVDNSELYDLNQEKYKQLSEKLTQQGIMVK